MKSETFLIDNDDNMLCSLSQTEFNIQCGEVDVDSWKHNDSEFNQYWNINSPKCNGFDCFTLKDRSEEIIPFVDHRMGVFEHLDKDESKIFQNHDMSYFSSLIKVNQIDDVSKQLSIINDASRSDFSLADKDLHKGSESCTKIHKSIDEENVGQSRKKYDTGMVKRKDQVMRDLIRKIKRVYKQRVLNSMEAKFKLSKEHSLKQLYQSLVAFVYDNISQIDSEQIAFALGCMTFPMKMSNMIHKNCFTFISNSNKSTYEQMLETIQRPFKRFNSKNLRSFINCGDIATVLIHFPEICVPFELSEDEAVGFGMIEDECMVALTS